MGDWPAQFVPSGLQELAIHARSPLSLGAVVTTASVAAAAWPATNDAIFIPFRVPTAMVAYQMACGTGTGTTGNFDLGIYDRFGNQLVSTGSTAKTTASSERIVNITDTTLHPGLYYMAMATDGTANYIAYSSSLTVAMLQLIGIRKMASAFALPSTATFATVTAAFLPTLSVYLRSE